MTNYASLATTLLVLGLCGCSAVSKERFSHRFHRLQYRLTDEEVKGLQFYISSRILAQVKSSPDVKVPTSGSVIVVPKDTPGVATQVGRDWIRVIFREGASGVVFFTDTTATNDIYLLYSLATDVEGSDIVQKVADVPGNVLLHEGTPYTVVEGYDSLLMVDVEQLQELIDKRKIGEGVEIK